MEFGVLLLLWNYTNELTRLDCRFWLSVKNLYRKSSSSFIINTQFLFRRPPEGVINNRGLNLKSEAEDGGKLKKLFILLAIKHSKEVD